MIENMTTELTMLGTGNATVTKCYNTCFTIKTGKNILLVDAGGGNGILGQLEKAGIAISEIHDMFVTHAHTDHILGAVWMVRIVMQKMLSDNIRALSGCMDMIRCWKCWIGSAGNCCRQRSSH